MVSRACELRIILARPLKIQFNFTVWNLDENPQKAAKKRKRKKCPLIAYTEKNCYVHINF